MQNIWQNFVRDKEEPLQPLAMGLKDVGEKRLALRLMGKLLSTKMIHNVPLLCMTSEIARFLGSIIGVVKEVDDGASGDCVGVVIDVYKLLSRILRMDVLRDRTESTMLLRYERLPEHCFRFGKIGHVVRECSIAAESDGPEDYNVLFGPWLKASSPIKFGQHRQYKVGSRSGGVIDSVNNPVNFYATAPDVFLSTGHNGGEKGKVVINTTELNKVVDKVGEVTDHGIRNRQSTTKPGLKKLFAEILEKFFEMQI
ncbi:hypothetical protein Ddye_016455 [Dipteronia dyeriana]|uniref:CCHC-type domain-containing protein n=1 Tax=Dipteronia dyeriana TaxID=168575 RepID=A0AAD9U7G0_9ROSI|nr:hypothetical protein Ddye_016455 [Dipteronia dyeriana]